MQETFSAPQTKTQFPLEIVLATLNLVCLMNNTSHTTTQLVVATTTTMANFRTVFSKLDTRTETKEGLYAHYFVAGCGGGGSGAPEDLFRDADAKGNINISNGAWWIAS